MMLMRIISNNKSFNIDISSILSLKINIKYAKDELAKREIQGKLLFEKENNTKKSIKISNIKSIYSAQINCPPFAQLN